MRPLTIAAISISLVHAQTVTPQPNAVEPAQEPTSQAQVAASGRKPVLPEATPLLMRINRTVSSADAHQNETVDFETLDDVKLGDLVVIPKGSTAIGTVTEAVPKRRLARGGKLSMNIDYVRLPSGERLALRGIQDLRGGGHTGVMTGAMVATGIVFFPAAPLFLFMKGKDITIPKGHEITVYTNTDYDLTKAEGTAVAAENAAPKRNTGIALTNDDVLKLKEAGLSDQLIVDKINASPGNYKLEADDLIALKNAGVPESIIAAMLQAQSAH
jgi:hypothetical protein